MRLINVCHRDKKGILVVSFGTIHENARRTNIEVVENRIKNEFNNYEVRRAFTSKKIINILKEKENIVIDYPTEALEKMMKDGFKEVLIQPLHIIPGVEYEKLYDIYNEYKNNFKKIRLGKPVLHNNDSCKEAVKALKRQLPIMDDNCAVVLLGHGTNHSANVYYSTLQSLLNEEKLNVVVATIENNSCIDNVIQKLKDNKVYEITLMPYLLVTGNHAEEDIFSDNENSWKSRLEKGGFLVKTYIHGLGENVEYQNIYVNRVKEVMHETN